MYVIPQGASLQNTKYIYGVCVYTGHETKLFLNTNEPALKRTFVDQMVNRQVSEQDIARIA